MTPKLVLAALVSLSLLPATVFASGGTDKFGPFASTSEDHGTCSYNKWANDTFDRFFLVHDNGDGSFSLREEIKNGQFETTGPVSPGGCETGKNHGGTVDAGITGNFTGFLAGTVTSASYDANGCDAADCSTVDGFIAAVFGSSASFTCDLGYAGCSFNFEYSSNDRSLQYHHWQDKSDNHGGEQFVGDIANI